MLHIAQKLKNIKLRHGDNWRDAARRAARLSCDAGLGWNGNKRVFYAFSEQTLPVRNVRFADEMLNLRHSGWFSDIDGSETIRGIVATLPRGRFVSGYYRSMNGEYVLFLDCLFDDADDAARYADEEAARLAESEREYNELWIEKRHLETLLEDKTSDMREYFAARHVSKKQKSWCRETIEELRDIKSELASAKFKNVD